MRSKKSVMASCRAEAFTSEHPGSPSSVDLEAIKFHAESHGLTLEEGEARDAWGISPKAAASEAATDFLRMFEVGFGKWTKVPPIMRYVVGTAIGKACMSSRLLCSNALIREKAAHFMIDMVSRHWIVSPPDRQWFFVTVIADSGNMLEYRPEMNLGAFQAATRQVVVDAGLHGIGATEFQAINNFPGYGHGRTTMANSHFICWTDRPEFDVSATEKRLCATSPLTHWLGAKTVRMDPIERCHRHITWKAHYMMKAPVDGKYSARNQNTPSGWGLNKSRIREDLAVGLMELLSQLEFPQLVMAVGDGEALRDEWLDDLQGWHRQQLNRAVWPRDDDMAEVWAWLRSRRRRGKPRHPFNLSIPTSAPSKWLSAAQEAKEKKSATRRHSKKSRRRTASSSHSTLHA